MTAKRPVKLSVFSIFVLWLFFMPCYAQGNMETKRLIQAARLDSLAALALPRALFPRASPLDPDFLKASLCISSTESSGFAEILADAAEKTMSLGEIQAALSFFESPTGLKYANITIWQTRADLALEQITPVPQLSKEDEDNVAQFLKTPAGIKLTTCQLLAVSHTALRLYELSAQLVRNCSAQPNR